MLQSVKFTHFASHVDAGKNIFYTYKKIKLRILFETMLSITYENNVKLVVFSVRACVRMYLVSM